jgi:hypothetical protein
MILKIVFSFESNVRKKELDLIEMNFLEQRTACQVLRPIWLPRNAGYLHSHTKITFWFYSTHTERTKTWKM